MPKIHFSLIFGLLYVCSSKISSDEGRLRLGIGESGNSLVLGRVKRFAFLLSVVEAKEELITFESMRFSTLSEITKVSFLLFEKCRSLSFFSDLKKGLFGNRFWGFLSFFFKF